MVTSKKTVFLGTNKISRSNKILVYNTNTFLDPYINNALGLTEEEVNILKKEPERNTVESIFETLRKHEEFLLIDRESSDNMEEFSFLFDNVRYNSISGQGFNVIIFLNNLDIIGFMVLLNVQGFNKSETKKYIRLKRNYYIKYINITIKSDDSELRVDKDVINIIDNINFTDRPYPFLKRGDIDTAELSKPLKKNYNNYISDIINGSNSRDVFTGNFFSKYSNKTNRFEFTQLKINKNLILPDNYKMFNHYQVGYYKGDLSIYMWNDNSEYSIYSLTSYLKVFQTKCIKPYTVPRKDGSGNTISKTNIYTLPEINKIIPTILYFSGNYIVCKVDKTKYLFDIDKQSGKDVYPNNGWVVSSYNYTDEYLYYKRNSELKWEPTEPFETTKYYNSLDLIHEKELFAAVRKRTPNYCTEFLIDPLDISCKIRKLNSLNWKNYSEAIIDCPELSEVFINYKNTILESKLLNKIGSWLVFEDTSKNIKIYTNFSKVIKFRLDEEDPIIVNDQVLIGRSDNTYTIYDESWGYFLSKKAKETLEIIYKNPNISDKDSYMLPYTSEVRDDKISNITDETSPVILQTDFWKYYRRNSLPKSLKNFELIGAIGGLIFYKLENKINYL